MDSQEDAARQVSLHLEESTLTDSDYFKNLTFAFCNNPFCLEETWHECGCYDLADDCLLDLKLQIPAVVSLEGAADFEKGCGLNNSNECISALTSQASTNIPQSTVSTAATRFALPRTEEEIERALVQSIPVMMIQLIVSGYGRTGPKHRTIATGTQVAILGRFV